MGEYLFGYLMLLSSFVAEKDQNKIRNYKEQLAKLKKNPNFIYEVGVYLENIRQFIHDKIWQTGLFGGQDCRIGDDIKIVPTHVKQIYEILNQESCSAHKFISIYLTAKHAKISCCLTRKPETQRFYENLVNFKILDYLPRASIGRLSLRM